MLLCVERTFEYRMRPTTTQEAALFTVLKASRQSYFAEYCMSTKREAAGLQPPRS